MYSHKIGIKTTTIIILKGVKYSAIAFFSYVLPVDQFIFL